MTCRANRLFTLIALLCVTSRDALGQADPDSIKHRNNCRLASHVVERAVPDPRRVWAHGYIRSCSDPQSKAAILSALSRLRTSTDTTALEFATAILVQVRDGDMFSAILGIAGDNTASVPARVVAFTTLAVLQDPYAAAEYEDFINGVDARGIALGPCTGRLSHPRTFTNGTAPMPSDYMRQILMVARRVRDDPRVPMHVRSAAACVT